MTTRLLEPKSCENEKVKPANLQMVTKRHASVVTRLWLKADCDRDLVAMAAAKVVEARKGEILRFFQQPLPCRPQDFVFLNRREDTSKPWKNRLLGVLSGSLVTFGFNFGEYDEHIIEAINAAAKKSPPKKRWSVYIGVTV